MTSWNDHSAEDKAAVLEKVAAVYEKHGHPSWLGPLTITNQMVNILMAGQYQEQNEMSISGKCAPDQAAKAAEVSADLNEALSSVSKVKISVEAGYDVGSPFPNIEHVNNVMTEGQTTLKHEKGQVLLVDFWATWCPPCQAPMAHNQKMLDEHGSKWGGKVRLMGLSIDNEIPKVKAHVEAKGWTSPEHYHVKGEGCIAQKMFGISGVPHVLIVDTEGIIVYKGHPASRPSLENDFDNLLAGKPLEGMPPIVKGGESAGSAAPVALEGTDDETANAAIEQFKSGAKAMMDEHKDKFQGIQRAFLVLVQEAKLCTVTKTIKHSLTCHSQLMGCGDQAKMDGAKELINKVNKNAAWKNEDQFRL